MSNYCHKVSDLQEETVACFCAAEFLSVFIAVKKVKSESAFYHCIYSILLAEPYFQVSWKDEVVDEGSDIRWSCDAYGKPSVQYKWYKDGMPFDVTTITPDDRNRIKWNEAQNVLTIKEVNPQKDNGLYQCAAYNQYDINFLTRELRVLSKYTAPKRMLTILPIQDNQIINYDHHDPKYL